MSLVYEQLTNQILKSAIKVHKKLGYGFVERIYEAGLEYELTKLGHKVERQKQLDIFYEDVLAGRYYADLIIDDQVIIELKATESLTLSNKLQLLHYLKATGYRVGLLINFGEEQIRVKRVIN